MGCQCCTIDSDQGALPALESLQVGGAQPTDWQRCCSVTTTLTDLRRPWTRTASIYEGVSEGNPGGI